MSTELFNLPASSDEKHMLATAQRSGFPGYTLKHLREDRSRMTEPKTRLLINGLAAGDTRRVWTLMRTAHLDLLHEIEKPLPTVSEAP